MDNTNIGAAVTTSPYSAVLDTTTYDGVHSLTAIATDSGSNIVNSAPVSVTVNNGPAPPTGTAFVTSFSLGVPRNNFTGWVGDAIHRRILSNECHCSRAALRDGQQ